MAFTAMPCRAHSRARARVKCAMPPFDAAWPGPSRRARGVDTLMMRPGCCASSRYAPKARHRRNVLDSRLAMSSSHAVSGRRASSRRRYGRVADEDVEAAERAKRVGHEPSRFGRIREIAGDWHSTPPSLTHAGAGLSGRLRCFVHGDVRARLGERHRDGGAKPAGRIGHESDPGIETKGLHGAQLSAGRRGRPRESTYSSARRSPACRPAAEPLDWNFQRPPRVAPRPGTCAISAYEPRQGRKAAALSSH